MNNLFADLSTDLPDELVEVLAENKHVRIKRIVSTGHASPDDIWYDQEEHEWIFTRFSGTTTARLVVRAIGRKAGSASRPSQTTEN